MCIFAVPSSANSPHFRKWAFSANSGIKIPTPHGCGLLLSLEVPTFSFSNSDSQISCISLISSILRRLSTFWARILRYRISCRIYSFFMLIWTISVCLSFFLLFENQYFRSYRWKTNDRNWIYGKSPRKCYDWYEMCANSKLKWNILAQNLPLLDYLFDVVAQYILYINGLVSIVVNIFAVHVILKRSTRHMVGYKWILLHVTVNLIYFEFKIYKVFQVIHKINIS